MNNAAIAGAAASITSNTSFVPFTGGILFIGWAYFWPLSYGEWLGTIVHAFRAKAGF